MTEPIPSSRSAREYPARPIVGVAGLVLHAGKVLLIRRGRPPLQGAWSLPGGALRTGELITEGVVREVREETGLVVVPMRQVATLDRIVHDEEGAVQFHYVLVDWLCALADTFAEPVASGDALEAAWVSPAELREMRGLDEVTLDLILQVLAAEGGV